MYFLGLLRHGSAARAPAYNHGVPQFQPATADAADAPASLDLSSLRTAGGWRQSECGSRAHAVQSRARTASCVRACLPPASLHGGSLRSSGAHSRLRSERRQETAHLSRVAPVGQPLPLVLPPVRAHRSSKGKQLFKFRFSKPGIFSKFLNPFITFRLFLGTGSGGVREQVSLHEQAGRTGRLFLRLAKWTRNAGSTTAGTRLHYNAVMNSGLPVYIARTGTPYMQCIISMIRLSHFSVICCCFNHHDFSLPPTSSTT